MRKRRKGELVPNREKRLQIADRQGSRESLGII